MRDGKTYARQVWETVGVSLAVVAVIGIWRWLA